MSSQPIKLEEELQIEPGVDLHEEEVCTTEDESEDVNLPNNDNQIEDVTSPEEVQKVETPDNIEPLAKISTIKESSTVSPMLLGANPPQVKVIVERMQECYANPILLHDNLTAVTRDQPPTPERKLPTGKFLTKKTNKKMWKFTKKRMQNERMPLKSHNNDQNKLNLRSRVLQLFLRHKSKNGSKVDLERLLGKHENGKRRSKADKKKNIELLKELMKFCRTHVTSAKTRVPPVPSQVSWFSSLYFAFLVILFYNFRTQLPEYILGKFEVSHKCVYDKKTSTFLWDTQ